MNRKFSMYVALALLFASLLLIAYTSTVFAQILKDEEYLSHRFVLWRFEVETELEALRPVFWVSTLASFALAFSGIVILLRLRKAPKEPC